MKALLKTLSLLGLMLCTLQAAAQNPVASRVPGTTSSYLPGLSAIENNWDKLNTPLEISLSSASLRSALQQIADASGLKLIYVENDLLSSHTVTLATEGRTALEALYAALEGTGLGLKISSGGSLVVSRRSVAEAGLVSGPQYGLRVPAAVPITGTVVDAETGETLPGVNIVIKGTATGTVTDGDGRFSLDVPALSDTLMFSFVGYLTQEVPIAGRSVVDVSLAPDVEQLEEVVVVGYGTIKKRNLTGSVSTISAEKIADRPVTRMEQVLAGNMPGVQVRQTSGEPGRPLEVRVRGGASISAENEPLYVVDGIPIDDLGNLNPNDIESIEVLKDAASAAIYGSRGANGVVIVTTRNGRPGMSRIQFTSSYGVQNIERNIDLLSAEEWIDAYTELQDSAWVRRGRSQNKPYKASDPIAYRLAELKTTRNSSYVADPRWQYGADSLAFIDWQEEFYRPAPIANYTLSGSGGTETLRYLISGNYLNQQGIAAYTGYDRLSLRANFDARLSKRVRLGLNLSPSIAWNTGGNVTGKDSQAHQVISIAPVAELEAGTMTQIKPFDRYYYAGSAASPIGFQKLSTNEVTRRQLFSKMELGIDLFRGMTANISGGWNTNMQQQNRYYPTAVMRSYTSPDGSRSTGYYNTGASDEYLFQTTLNYVRSFGPHNFNAVAGGSVEYYQAENSYQRHNNFPDDALQIINLGRSTVLNSENSIYERSLASVLGRVIYDYKGKYLITASFRGDGSSKFGESNKWGYFPSFSAAWRVSDENFLKGVDWLSNLKLRYSIGRTGNNRIPDYAAYGRVGTYNYGFNNAVVYGYGPNSITNPNLGWEQTTSMDVGLDLGLFDDRITLVTDYYRKNTTDLLLSVPVALSTGFASTWENIGEVMNEGLEFEVTGRVTGRKFSWEPSANLSFNRNEVVKLGPGDTPIYTGFSGQTAIIKVGEPLMAYYLYDAVGVYMNEQDLANSPKMPTNIVGDVKYRDVNGDGKITPDDRTILGHRDPSYTFGFSNTFYWKKLDFSFLIQGQGGNQIYSILGRVFDRPGMGASTQKLGRWRNRWRSPENPGDGITPRLDGTTGSFYDSRWLYDGDYIRLRNVTLGYTLPANLVRGMGAPRIYVSGENLFLKDDYYGGYTPEADNNEGGDYGGYPTARTVTVGLSLSF